MSDVLVLKSQRFRSEREADWKRLESLLELLETGRMSRLSDNVLDFARGRLGGGLSWQRSSSEPVEQTLRQVLAELQSSNLTRTIDATFDIREPVNCDVQRVGQLFSNLLGNAVMHDSPDVPIEVGVFGASPGAGRDGKPLYLQKRLLPDGDSTITVTVDGKPALAGVDPYNELIDKVSSDNRRAVTLH